MLCKHNDEPIDFSPNLWFSSRNSIKLSRIFWDLIE